MIKGIEDNYCLEMGYLKDWYYNVILYLNKQKEYIKLYRFINLIKIELKRKIQSLINLKVFNFDYIDIQELKSNLHSLSMFENKIIAYLRNNSIERPIIREEKDYKYLKEEFIEFYL